MVQIRLLSRGWMSAPLEKSRKPDLSEKLDKSMSKLFDVVDVIGQHVFGKLWDLVFESIQDSFTFGVLAVFPSWILQKFTGQDFTNWQTCLSIEYSDVDRYFCFVVIAALFGGLISFALRLAKRFIKSIIS